MLEDRMNIAENLFWQGNKSNEWNKIENCRHEIKHAL